MDLDYRRNYVGSTREDCSLSVPDQEGAIAPLRKQRQAFLEAFMDHAETFLTRDYETVLRARLRILLSDAWYDGYIAGERHANSHTSSQTVSLTDSPELLTNPHPDPKA